MKKENLDLVITKAEKRARKNRLRMKIHGRNLKLQTPHAGGKLTKKK